MECSAAHRDVCKTAGTSNRSSLGSPESSSRVRSRRLRPSRCKVQQKARGKGATLTPCVDEGGSSSNPDSPEDLRASPPASGSNEASYSFGAHVGQGGGDPLHASTRQPGDEDAPGNADAERKGGPSQGAPTPAGRIKKKPAWGAASKDLWAEAQGIPCRPPSLAVAVEDAEELRSAVRRSVAAVSANNTPPASGGEVRAIRRGSRFAPEAEGGGETCGTHKDSEVVTGKGGGYSSPDKQGLEPRTTSNPFRRHMRHGSVDSSCSASVEEKTPLCSIWALGTTEGGTKQPGGIGRSTEPCLEPGNSVRVKPALARGKQSDPWAEAQGILSRDPSLSGPDLHELLGTVTLSPGSSLTGSMKKPAALESVVSVASLGAAELKGGAISVGAGDEGNVRLGKGFLGHSGAQGTRERRRGSKGHFRSSSTNSGRSRGSRMEELLMQLGHGKNGGADA